MEKKNDLVIHHNYLNESIFNFNELELNLFIVIIYKMREEKEALVTFNAKDIKNLINSKDRSYKKFEKIIHSLQDRTIYLKTEKGYKRVKPFPTLDFNNEQKTIEVEVNNYLVPFFKELKEQFTQYSLKEFLKLKSKHSKRLYQLLKQYEKLGKRNFNLELLKELLDCDTQSYKRIYNFENRILKTIQNDINTNTSLEVNYTKIKDGREIKSIEFDIKTRHIPQENFYVEEDSRQEIIKKSLEIFGVSYIKDLSENQKRLLNLSLELKGFKPTT